MPAPRTELPRLTDRLPLGTRGLQVSPYCVGLVSDPDVILAAFDAGINFFFVTADMHWPLYRNTREGLARLFARGGSIRDQVVVAGCSYSTQPEFCTMPFMEVVSEVRGLARLDVLVAGGIRTGEFVERLPVYEGHLRRGFLGSRSIGGSFHVRQTAVTAINHSMVDISFIRYNAEHPGAKSDLLPFVKAHPRPLIYNFTNTHGRPTEQEWEELEIDEDYWRPGFTDYYRFVLARPEIDGLLIAPQQVAHIKGLEEMIQEGPISPDEEEHIANITEMKNGLARLKTPSDE
jgi:hypothetical protein